jgi:Ca2+-transporting ATPase
MKRGRGAFLRAFPQTGNFCGCSVSFGLLLAVLYIPFLQPIFKTFALSWYDWTIVIGYCTIPFLAGELYKPMARRLAMQD